MADLISNKLKAQNKTEELELEKKKLEILLNGMNKAVVSIDTRGNIDKYNVKFRDIFNIEDEELENGYRRIQNLLNEMILQKDTNDLLIKQQLSFTNKLLNLINPKRDIQTYNSYGSIKR